VPGKGGRCGWSSTSSRALLEAAPDALIVFGDDGLKQVNDTHGHAASRLDALTGRLARAVGTHDEEHGGTPLSLSVGTSVAREGERVDAALGEADRKMHSLKRPHHEAT
jgi:hypothetical protein